MAFALLIAALATPADLSQIGEIVGSAPSLNNAFVGIQVLSLKTGEVLYAHNQDRLFVPASNTKLFTTALALSRLGAQYRMHTLIGAAQPADPAGTLSSDLILVGGGDPSLSGREYPYRNEPPGDPPYSFRAIEDLADQLLAHGLHRVEGDIVGDDRRYVWEPNAEGWAVGDAPREYGAPASALILDDNSFALALRPGARPGDLAQIRLAPPFEYFAIDNRVRTVRAGERKIEWERQASSRELHIWGEIPEGDAGATLLIAVDDPALYAASVLRDALLRRGIPVRGRARARHLFADVAADFRATEPPVVLAERDSPPLTEILQVVDKVSQNLHAEVLLREVGAVADGPGSRQAGLAALAAFLAEAGIQPDEFRFIDGSGLSRGNLVSPAAITKLLAHMYASSERDQWLALLPVAGLDGTLASRLADRPEARAIHAKTGTLDHVRALSGYAESPVYGPLAFSFLVNNFDAPSAEIIKLLDDLALVLVN